MYADLLPASDGTAPFAIHTFNQITGGNTIYPRQAAIANDHFVFTGREDDERADEHRPRVRESSTASRSRTTRRLATASFTSISPSRDSSCRGSSSPAPTRTAAPTARTARSASASARRRSGSAGRRATSISRWRRRAASTFSGTLQPWVSGKDIVLELLRRWGAQQSQGMSVEFVDANRQLPIAYRNTIANMMAEAEALNGIFAADDITYAWYARKGVSELPYPRIAPGDDARFEIDETLSLGDVRR